MRERFGEVALRDEPEPCQDRGQPFLAFRRQVLGALERRRLQLFRDYEMLDETPFIAKNKSISAALVGDAVRLTQCHAIHPRPQGACTPLFIALA